MINRKIFCKSGPQVYPCTVGHGLAVCPLILSFTLYVRSGSFHCFDLGQFIYIEHNSIVLTFARPEASERRRRRGRSPPQCWNHGGESIFSPPQYLYQLGISKELIIHHLFTLSFQAYNLPFLQILLTVSFLFSSSGLTPRIPRTVIDTSEHIRFHCLVIFSTF